MLFSCNSFFINHQIYCSTKWPFKILITNVYKHMLVTFIILLTSSIIILFYFSFILSVFCFCHLFKVENLIVQYSMMKFQQNADLCEVHSIQHYILKFIFDSICGFICVFRLYWPIKFKWNIVNIHVICTNIRETRILPHLVTWLNKRR